MSVNNIATISVHELKKRRDENPNLCLIDVRELNEWQEVRIPGALHIPKDKITEQIKGIAPESHCPIYLHCHAGIRSLYAAHCLVAMGYVEVYSIDGGISEWQLCGYPVEKETK